MSADGGIRFVVPGIPSSLNVWTRSHWRTRHSESLSWNTRIQLFYLSQYSHLPRPAFTGGVHLLFEFRRPRSKKLIDVDNMAPKHLVDAMRGLLFPDDSPKWVKSITMTAHRDVGIPSDETLIMVEPDLGDIPWRR